MDCKFIFIILDKLNRNVGDDENEAVEELYVHPSTNEKFLELRGAILTLHDLASSIENGNNEPCSSITMRVQESLVEFTVFEDSVRNFVYLFGQTIGKQSTTSSSCLLHAVCDLLNFIAVDLRSSLLDAHFRSDVDGLIVAAIHSVLPSAPLGDPTIAVCYSNCEDMDELNSLMMKLEAGDFFDQEQLNILPENIFVVGSCFFVNEIVVANHFPNLLFKKFHLFMNFHRKGFRRIKRGDGATVIQYYYQDPNRQETTKAAENFLIWTNKGSVILAVCVELPSSKHRTALLNIVISGLLTALEEAAIETLISAYAQPRISFLFENQSGNTTTGKKFFRSVSIPSTTVSKEISVSSRATSVSNDTLVDTQPVSRKSFSKLIYRITVNLDDSSVYWETFANDYRKNAMIPPSLLEDFLEHISLMNKKLKASEEKVEEMAVMLEYPAPALVRKYWISGWKLEQPCREVFTCYPDGAGHAALLEIMTG